MDIDEYVLDRDDENLNGKIFFNQTLKELAQFEGIVRRRAELRDDSIAAETARCNAWYAAETEYASRKIIELKAVIEARMSEYVKATGQHAVTTPHGRVTMSAPKEKWVWPEGTDEDTLVEWLAGIDEESFVRSKTTREVRKNELKDVVELKEIIDDDGNMAVVPLLDGEPLPHVVVTMEQKVTAKPKSMDEPMEDPEAF